MSVYAAAPVTIATVRSDAITILFVSLSPPAGIAGEQLLELLQIQAYRDV